MEGASNEDVDKKVREQFAAMDANSDGKVTFEELRSHMRRVEAGGVEAGQGGGKDLLSGRHIFIHGSSGLLRSLLREDELTLRRRIDRAQVAAP
jgi:hypothetical protein